MSSWGRSPSLPLAGDDLVDERVRDDVETVADPLDLRVAEVGAVEDPATLIEGEHVGGWRTLPRKSGSFQTPGALRSAYSDFLSPRRAKVEPRENPHSVLITPLYPHMLWS